MSYTSVTKVRQEAGIVGNSNITDARIMNYMTLVDNEIDSYLVDVYTLPLPVFFENTITFSGTGSGSATMTITIDSLDYDIAVTSGLSDSGAADLFRTAASNESDKDFVVFEGLGSGEIVTIYTLGQSGTATDVTISSTDPQTVQGIISTGGTVTATPVKVIEAISSGLAAARLLIAEYGPEAQDSDKDGFKKLALYQDMLNQIQGKELKLFDFAGNELPRSSNKQLKFFPGANSEDANEEDITDQFTINAKF